MEDYVHIYKNPRSLVQRDTRQTEPVLENRHSRHDYEPISLTQGVTNQYQQPQVDDSNVMQTISSNEEKDLKQQIRFLCIFSVTGIVALAVMLIIVVVSVSVVAIRSNELSDEVAHLQQQLEEMNYSMQVTDNLSRRHNITYAILC